MSSRARGSRYPVYQESLDEIVGVVHAKDILAALRNQPGSTLRGIMRAPLFVPGTREVEDVLTDMKRLKVHLAVVLDEYGGTAGLVTMEDLLEEIVGPIFDEYDRPGGACARRAPDRRRDAHFPVQHRKRRRADDTDHHHRWIRVRAVGRLPGREIIEVPPFTLEVANGRRRVKGGLVGRRITANEKCRLQFSDCCSSSPSLGQSHRKSKRFNHRRRIRRSRPGDIECRAMVR
jgi:hypothetical protein